MQIQITDCVIPVTPLQKMVFTPPRPARPNGVVSAVRLFNHFAKGDEGIRGQFFDFEFHHHSVLVRSNLNVRYGTSLGGPPNPEGRSTASSRFTRVLATRSSSVFSPDFKRLVISTW